MRLIRLSKILFVCARFRAFTKGPQRGEKLRKALERLGPIFVKFGQILSIRSDFLPQDVIAELAKLQDQVPPFSGDEAVSMIESAYKKSLSDLFAAFSKQPLASASIAQVHAAVLPDGRDVVVKLLRPRIRRTIRSDLRLMSSVANFLHRFVPNARALRLPEVVDEIKKTLFSELDLAREAANASQLRRNFLGSPLLYVPEVMWKYVRPNVIVMERIDGIPVDDIEQLKAHNIDLKKLAERGVEIFLRQVFKDSFFHADMHPGNIFVQKKLNPKYIAVDFGIMGSLHPNDQRYLAENLLAFFNRDYRRIAVLHVESGWVKKTTRIDEFEFTIRALCEPIFAKPLKDISVAQLFLQLLKAARQFDMQVQPQLLLLQKTLLNVEALGKQLYPELDLWQSAKPFLESWVKEQMGFKAIFNRLQQGFPEVVTFLKSLVLSRET